MLYGHMGEFKRAASRIVLIAAIGGFAVEASAEVSRSSSPFSNPFEARASAEPRVTGSLSGAVPRTASATASAAPIRLAMASPTATSAAPKPAAAKVASSKPAAAKSSGGWKAEGGTSINVAPGDSLATIANRYGVPSSAILSANGVSAGQVAPGRRIVIPVYSATGGSDSAAKSTPKAAAKAPAATPSPVVAAAAPKPAPKAAAALPKAESRAKLADIAAAAAKPAKAAAQPAEKVAVKAALAPKVVVAKAEPKPAPVKVAKVEAPKVEAQKTAKAEAKVAAATPKTPAPVAVKVAAAPAKVEPTKATKAAALKAGAQPEAVKVAAAAVKEPEATGALPATPVVAAAPTAEFRWPARGRVITGFGGSGGNEGINIAVPDGTPIKAAEAGTVAYAGSEVKGYGNLVLIRHDNGFVSAYAHAGEIDVKRGQKVARGQVIAKSGQSGNVTSPQLHFEIRKGSTPIDPMLHLASN